MIVYPQTNLTTVLNSSHPLFKFVEKQFYNWIENSNPCSEYKEKYFGDEAIYTKRGAIEQALEEAIDLANEDDKPVNLNEFDFDAVFGD